MTTAQQISAAGSRDSGNEPAGSSTDSSTSTATVSRSRTRRWEIGFFVRKVVNGHIVSEWQLPPRRRPHGEEVSAGGQSVVRQGNAEAAPRPALRSLALHAAEEDAVDTSEPSGTTGGPTSETTTYEAGFFVRQESTVPPVYKDPPDG